MSANHQRSARRSGVVLLGLVAASAVGQVSLAEQRAAIATGEVVGNNVYVRSGPSLNHYTVCKLDAGQRVTILGERGEWYEILPPAGTFSLISGEYVDRGEGAVGVVNGNNVRVRAGSQLNDNKYTVQNMLVKGTEVTIVGESPDGFLRIQPPEGASLWIHRTLVEPVPDERLRLEAGEAPAVEGSDAPQPARAAEPAGAPDAATENAPSETAEQVPPPKRPRMSLTAVAAPTALRTELDQLDEAMRIELAKPLDERNLDPLLDRYRSIAGQQEDELARQYAQRRLEQSSYLLEVAGAMRALRNLDGDATEVRRRFMSERSGMRHLEVPEPAALDAQGELRASALYAGGNTPKRYRLVDPTTPDRKTIAYVEIPPDLPLREEDFLGRYVGVRASDTRLLTRGIDPVPIYIASELIILDPPKSGGQRANAD